MADGDNQQLVKLLILGGAGLAAYKLMYEPWSIQRRLQAEIEAQTRANMAKGMGIEEASQHAISGACQAVAAFYKIPPASSGGVCAGVGVLAEKSVKALAQGAIIAGKVLGKGVGAGAVAVGHTAAALGRGVGHTAAVLGRGVGTGAKFVGYTAPKKVVTTAAKAVKFVSYTAPKKVATTAAKDVGKGAVAVAKGVKSVAKSISHGFGLWGLDVDATPPGRPRRSNMGPLGAAVRRQARGDLAPERKRRGLAGVPAAGRRRSAGASFYTKHLR